MFFSPKLRQLQYSREDPSYSKMLLKDSGTLNVLSECLRAGPYTQCSRQPVSGSSGQLGSQFCPGKLTQLHLCCCYFEVSSLWRFKYSFIKFLSAMDQDKCVSRCSVTVTNTRDITKRSKHLFGLMVSDCQSKISCHCAPGSSETEYHGARSMWEMLTSW